MTRAQRRAHAITFVGLLVALSALSLWALRSAEQWAEHESITEGP